jgi:hydrogenase small subunit
MAANDGAAFVLIVEGAVQAKELGGYWGKTGHAGDTPWCAIGQDGRGAAATGADLSFDDVVEQLATRVDCKAVVAIGQCATFGGYPACIGSGLANLGQPKGQTGAMGVYDFLVYRGSVNTSDGKKTAATAASNKVINVPGCPTNPWWFALTVVIWLVEASTALKTGSTGGMFGILDTSLNIVGGVDSQRRLTKVYGDLLHGKYCPRYPFYAMRKFASKPGDAGCLKNIGCKGLSTHSLCGRHGWDGQQPQNTGLSTAEGNMYTLPENAVPDGKGNAGHHIGGNCIVAGSPCMGCTEKGYPDAFVPFVVRQTS